MELSFERQTIEIEQLIGEAGAQALVRAEATVSGASREPAEPLMEDATLTIGAVEVQNDRVVLDGTVYCQAIYRQGDDATVRALTAQAQFNQVVEIEGASPKMIPRVQGAVEHVEAGYDNGRMIFQVAISLRAQVLQLQSQEVINQVSGIRGLETEYDEITSVKVSAEASADAVLREEVPLPPQLDPRLSLLDWYSVKINQTQPDLGGVRVQGEVQVETLIGTGVAMRPVALVKVAMPFDQLVELPDWLSGNVQAEAGVGKLTSQIDQGLSEGDDATLKLEAELNVHIWALGKDSATALTDAYAPGDNDVVTQRQRIVVCKGVTDVNCAQPFRGTLLLPEGAPGVGTVLAVRARPTLSQWSEEGGETALEGVLEVGVLYLPGGSEKLYAVRSELPFSIRCNAEIPADAWIRVDAVGAEASALMSDRLEFKCTLRVEGFARDEDDYTIATEAGVEPAQPRQSGLMIVWPQDGDSAWSIGKKYRIPLSEVKAQAGDGATLSGKPIVMRVTG